MVTNKNEHTPKTPAKQGADKVIPKPIGVRMVATPFTCVTLSFTTPCRFIPTLSSQYWLPHKDGPVIS